MVVVAMVEGKVGKVVEGVGKVVEGVGKVVEGVRKLPVAPTPAASCPGIAGLRPTPARVTPVCRTRRDGLALRHIAASSEEERYMGTHPPNLRPKAR